MAKAMSKMVPPFLKSDGLPGKAAAADKMIMPAPGAKKSPTKKAVSKKY